MVDVDECEIVVTGTAKSKTSMYYSAWEIRRKVGKAQRIYYDHEHDSYLLKTEQNLDGYGSQGRSMTVVIVVAAYPEEKKLVAITQTSDHYNWSRYDRVGEFGEVPEGYQ